MPDETGRPADHQDEAGDGLVLVEFRLEYSAELKAIFGEKNVWPPSAYAETDVAYVARDVEDARRFCRENADYAEHDPDSPWHFTLLTAAVGSEDPTSIRVIEHVDWDGRPVTHDHDVAETLCPLCDPGGNPAAHLEITRAVEAARRDG